MDPSAPSIQKFDATAIVHEALAHAPMYNQHHHLEHRLMHLMPLQRQCLVQSHDQSMNDALKQNHAASRARHGCHKRCSITR